MYFRSLSDLLFPRFCLGCEQRLDIDERLVCEACKARLFRLRLDWTDNFRLEQWFVFPAVKRVVGFTVYKLGGLAATLVQQAKYRRHPELGRWMGRLAASELVPTDAFQGVDVIVPMPLARKKFKERGFNQAEQIALGVSEVIGVPVRNDLMERVLYKESQTHFRREQRFGNADNSFRAPDPDALRGHHVLLVDDVLTTGSTLDSVILQLKDIPQISITVFAWAWTLS